MLAKLILPVAAIVFSVPLNISSESFEAHPVDPKIEGERFLEFHVHLDAARTEEARMEELTAELEESLEELAHLDRMMRELTDERARLLEQVIELQRELLSQDPHFRFMPHAPTAPRAPGNDEAWPYRPR